MIMNMITDEIMNFEPITSIGTSNTVKPKIKFDHDKCIKALNYAEDLADRCLMPFFVLGETAYQIVKGDFKPLELSEIHIGIDKAEMTRSTRETMLTLEKGLIWEEDVLRLKYGDVPIRIDLVERDNKYIQNLDHAFYYVSQYQIPNPFDEYWEEYKNAN